MSSDPLDEAFAGFVAKRDAADAALPQAVRDQRIAERAEREKALGQQMAAQEALSIVRAVAAEMAMKAANANIQFGLSAHNDPNIDQPVAELMVAYRLGGGGFDYSDLTFRANGPAATIRAFVSRISQDPDRSSQLVDEIAFAGCDKIWVRSAFTAWLGMQDGTQL